MMYRHIVFFWLHDHSEERISEVCEKLRAMCGEIVGLISVEVEPDARGQASRCHLCMNLLFESKEALEAYRSHPKFQRVLSQMTEIREQTHMADYPVARPVRRMPKLYAFIGPSNRRYDTLYSLLGAGMSGIRLSLEHHTLGECLPIARDAQRAAAAQGVQAEILLEPYGAKDQAEGLRQLGATGLIMSLPHDEGAIRALRAEIDKDIRLYARVDCAGDVSALHFILQHADEIIVSRSGLCRNIPRHQVPGAQKRIAALCRSFGKPFMIATDLLQTMRGRHFPSTAELCDIYNAVYDGASSLMLSQEVCVGRYPVEAMETLRRAAEAALVP